MLAAEDHYGVAVEPLERETSAFWLTSLMLNLLFGHWQIPKHEATPVVPNIASNGQTALEAFSALAKLTASLSRDFACESLGSGG